MKILKDYNASEPVAPQIISGQAPEPARPYEGTAGESAGGVFDQRGTSHEDSSPEGEGESIHHPWKVTPGEEEGTWDVFGDYVFSSEVILPVFNETITGDGGWIYLKTTRDSSSRELTDAELLFGATIPESDYEYQYRAIAYVDSEAEAPDKPIRQVQFEEIRIEELLIVANGEFRLAPVEMSSRNRYELPPA
jgi:hypothetical protein